MPFPGGSVQNLSHFQSCDGGGMKKTPARMLVKVRSEVIQLAGPAR